MTIEEQVDYLMQGTAYGDENLRQAMQAELKQRLIECKNEGRPLRIYCGFDPRTSDLHLGHTVPMRKLRQFQELGHQVIFLIGNYTSLIGDPSDKDKLRPQLTPAEVEQNAHTYAEQAYKILDAQKTEIRHNAQWLAKLTFAELINLAANFTVQQFITRENFHKRWENGDPVYLHETFYSIMQGYDAYALQCDVQIGGTDQLFNIVTAARKIMTFLGAKPNIAIILDILPGTDGVVKMSKSLGNHIPLLSDAEDMFGKVMSIPDKAMPSYFRLLTRWTPPQIEALEQELASGKTHPRDTKMKLAYEIVSIYCSEEAAKQAEQTFIRVFQERQTPQDMPEYQAQENESVLDILINTQLINSKSEGKRVIAQDGVRINGELVKDALAPLPSKGVLQVGKRKYIRII